MPNYRRVFTDGGCWFFTVNLENRRSRLLTEHIDWSWIFFVNVPVGAAGVIAGWIVIAESRDMSTEQSLDLPGLVVSAAALFALTNLLVDLSYALADPRIRYN